MPDRGTHTPLGPDLAHVQGRPESPGSAPIQPVQGAHGTPHRYESASEPLFGLIDGSRVVGSLGNGAITGLVLGVLVVGHSSFVGRDRLLFLHG